MAVKAMKWHAKHKGDSEALRGSWASLRTEYDPRLIRRGFFILDRLDVQ